MTIANAVKVLGLGPRLLQQDGNPVDECNDWMTEGCGCCKIVPCALCLEWEVYGKVTDEGEAYGDGTQWTGSAGGIGFRAYIDPNYCTINIELDGNLVYTASILCLGDQYPTDDINCRDFSDEVAYDSPYESGVFRWTKKELFNLNPQAGAIPTQYTDGECADHYCGTCECITEHLCVTVTNDINVSCTGEIPFDGTLCPDSGKVSQAHWGGNVGCQPNGSVDVAVSLDPNAYTNECELTGTVSGTVDGTDVNVDMPLTIVGECSVLNVSWTEVIDGDTWTFTIETLHCGTCGGGCCTGQPDTLTCTLESAACSCLDGVSVSMDKISNGNGWAYSGDPGTCFPPNPTNMDFSIECTSDDGCGNWSLTVVDVQGCRPGGTETFDVEPDCSCNPLILEFIVPISGMGGCCDGGMVSGDLKFIITR
jgi:hypothetical protein